MKDVYTIVDESTGDDLRLALQVGGTLSATAGAPSDVVAQMQAQFDMTTDDIRSELKDALERLYRNELERVAIHRMREDPPGSLHFIASYVYRDFRNVTQGVVWYDLPSGKTGPEQAPALVRMKFRYEVILKLTAGDSGAEALLRALQ